MIFHEARKWQVLGPVILRFRPERQQMHIISRVVCYGMVNHLHMYTVHGQLAYAARAW